MNQIFSVVFNASLGLFQAVPEIARARGKGKSGRAAKPGVARPDGNNPAFSAFSAFAGTSPFAGVRRAFGVLPAAVALAFGAGSSGVWAGPVGGEVAAGRVDISGAGNVTNIRQTTQRGIINWRGFSVGKGETVNFQQPNARAATLNRVVGGEKSVIDGALNANGRVYLINSQGVLFGRDARVKVGGLVASALDMKDEDFLAGRDTFFAVSGADGRVENRGEITAAEGGFVAFFGQEAINEGIISARRGAVALAAGDKVTLNLEDSLFSVTISEGALAALVENRQALEADGGAVFLTAKAANALVEAQVNNTGVIRARTLDDLAGRIELYARGGVAHVDGTLDASAPVAGDGGLIETSGDAVSIADGAVMTTRAENGKSGTWLIDPTDFIVYNNTLPQASYGVGNATLQGSLAKGNVTIITSADTTGAGNITVNGPIAWSSGNNLTLAAAHDIIVNQPIQWSGGALTLNAGANINIAAVLSASDAGGKTAAFAANYGRVIDLSTGAPTAEASPDEGAPFGLSMARSPDGAGYAGRLDFPGDGALTINGESYNVINDKAALAAVSQSPEAHYALGGDLAGLEVAALDVLGLTAPARLVGHFQGFGHSLAASDSGPLTLDSDMAPVSNTALSIASADAIHVENIVIAGGGGG
ncbi:MAG: filamentous hemagglutinin N-terminal domain-containing protein [Candidatus Accumulibacter sp.]|jgi:filamentous hemagglutinin family protein|nr:filamentous hemagglutinin N-terminal domain-containing protein [Accumulibacter sp.]